MKILIATKNPAKIEGAKQAFEKYYSDVEIEGISAPSNVSEQPVNIEIYEGADNRAKNLCEIAKNNNISADYFVAIESGITNAMGKWTITNVAVIYDKNGYQSWGTSAGFPVPEKYVDEIISTTFGEFMDKLFNENDLRSKKGGINFLTNEVISRIDITRDTFIMALTQYITEIWRS